MRCELKEPQSSFKVRFYLYDQISELQSEKIDFWIFPMESQRIPILTMNFISYLLLFLTLLIILFLGVLVCFYRKKKNQSLQNSIEANQNLNNHFQHTTVLSQSILHWNKKLILIHKDKSSPRDEESKFDYHEDDMQEDQQHISQS